MSFNLRTLCTCALLLAAFTFTSTGCSKEKAKDAAEIEAARQEHISQAQREMEDIKNNK